ncbi:MAG TPA: HDOD domain-containing protein [Spirochaetia bacterium]|nr:HDOD domain-containing protein [Spirochaetia bacterium]
MSTEIDVEQIKRAAQDAIPLTFKTYTLPHETEIYLDKVLESFLSELGQEKLKEPLSYCLRELAVNAKKANTKRVYFQEKKLDLGKDQDYELGMKTFKQETFDNLQYYLQKQKEAGLYIKVVFQTKAKTLTIMVRNNVEITKKEQIRVFDRLARSRAFSSLEEAFATVLDSSEGAGLGIVILVLMMKKIGLTEDCFSVDIENGETVASITIPFSEIHLEQLDTLTQILVREVEALPQFPENIINLQRLLADPNHEITDIAREISVDPSMTADLLKLVNSAQFMLPKRVDNIVEAVKLVGTKGVRNLLYSYGTQKVLGEKYSEMRSMWTHAYRAAFYAYILAKSFKRKKEMLDDVYVGGILHDLGQIVIASLHPDLLDRITKVCREKGIPAKLLEDFSIGLNHAEVGALIAKKWNFPEQLISAIRYHHEPTQAPAAHRDIVSSVYLANVICDMERERMGFDQIQTSVLKDFGIETAEQLARIQEKLSKAFEDQRAKFQ